MTLREKLKEIGGVGSPVKIGFDTGWVYAGRLCENYESVIDALNNMDKEKNIEFIERIKTHIEIFDEYWEQKIKNSMEQLEREMDYERCREDYRFQIKMIKDELNERQKRLEEITKSINEADTSKLRNALYLRKKAVTQSIYRRRNIIFDLTKALKESESNKDLTEEEKQEKRIEKEIHLNNAKDADWKSSNEKLEFYTTELNRQKWLDREVLSETDSIDVDEIDGMKNLIVEGSVYGKYWFSSEMDRDKKMQELIVSFIGTNDEKGKSDTKAG